MDYGDPNEPVGQVQNFCIRFKNSDIANEFKKVFEECQVGLLNIPMTTPGRKDSEGISKSRIAMNEEKVNKMKDELNYFKDKFEKNEEIKLGEGGGLTPLVKQHKEKLNRTKSVLPTPTIIDNKKDESDSPEKEANVSFTPVLEKLPDLVDETTGEEEETVVFGSRGKLYIWKDEQWKERGLGGVKILSKNGASRIVMRRDQVMKVCLNMPINKETPDVKDKKDSNGKAVNFIGLDFSGMATESKDMNVVGEEGVTASESGELLSFALRLKTEEIAGFFKTAFMAGKNGESIAPVFVQKDEPKSIKSPEPVKSPEKEEEPAPVSTGPKFSFTGFSAPKTTGGFSFATPTKDVKPATGGFNFGAPAGKSEPKGFNFGPA